MRHGFSCLACIVQDRKGLLCAAPLLPGLSQGLAASVASPPAQRKTRPRTRTNKRRDLGPALAPPPLAPQGGHTMGAFGKASAVSGLMVFGTTTSLFAKIGEVLLLATTWSTPSASHHHAYHQHHQHRRREKNVFPPPIPSTHPPP